MADALTLRLMTRDEVDELLAWAAAEGWNPGLHDAELFWQADAEAFVAAEVDGELVGGGAIVSYGGRFGFMGLFIIRPAYRGRGLGTRLWKARLQLLRGRLQPAAPIGLDGVYEMQDWYARGGFVLSHRSIRYQADGGVGRLAAGVVPAADVGLEAIAALDRRCFPGPRDDFLRAWLAQPDALALAAPRADVTRGAAPAVRGFGVIRRCGVGAKVGPLFADDAATAEALLRSLATFAPGEPLFIDVPEVNAWAMSLAARLRMRPVFGCARMYLGAPPRLDESRIFGITTFELG